MNIIFGKSYSQFFFFLCGTGVWEAIAYMIDTQ